MFGLKRKKHVVENKKESQAFIDIFVKLKRVTEVLEQNGIMYPTTPMEYFRQAKNPPSSLRAEVDAIKEHLGIEIVERAAGLQVNEIKKEQGGK